ncbi:MAG: phosphatidylglycerol lysyltransferase domain-containing protein [Thermodesulfobacteriota bacterium]
MRDELREYLLRYGYHSCAYSSLQEGLDYFVLPGRGYIPYALSSGMAFVLSNPVCGAADFQELVGSFVESFPRSAFLHVTPEAAGELAKMGFYLNEMGVETELSLGAYDYRGRAKESMRRMMRRALECGTEVVEVSGDGGLGHELREVTEEWLSTKRIKEREFRFLVRRAVYHSEPDVRKFIAIRGGRIAGYVVFDPMYRHGRVYGYLAGTLRTRASAHGGTLALIMSRAIEAFKAEGVEVLSLGLSPFFDVDDARYRHSYFMKQAFRFLYERGGGLYSFKGLSFFKSRYAGGLRDGLYRDNNVTKRKIYFAHRSRLPLLELYESSRLMGLTSGLLPVLKSLFPPFQKWAPRATS